MKGKCDVFVKVKQFPSGKSCVIVSDDFPSGKCGGIFKAENFPSGKCDVTVKIEFEDFLRNKHDVFVKVEGVFTGESLISMTIEDILSRKGAWHHCQSRIVS